MHYMTPVFMGCENFNVNGHMLFKITDTKRRKFVFTLCQNICCVLYIVWLIFVSHDYLITLTDIYSMLLFYT